METNNKLAVVPPIEWGEDPIAHLAKCRESGDSYLIRKAEEKIMAVYLQGIREAFEERQSVISIITNSSPAISASEKVQKSLEHLLKPGSEDLFKRAIDYALEELDIMRQAPPSLYLVNSENGKIISPIKETDLYKKPDFIGEDGQIQTGRTALNPFLAAKIGMQLHESDKLDKIRSQNPDFDIIDRPESILDLAESKLSRVGIERSRVLSEGEIHSIEFGKEQIDSALQSQGRNFRRLNVFSAILAQRIRTACNGSKKYDFISFAEKRDSKYKWYFLTIRVEREEQEEIGKFDPQK